MSMNGDVFIRRIARIDNPPAEHGLVPGHKARRLISGAEPTFTDPFVLMAEDWMPRDAFGIHPHRGIETVTYVLDGAVEHFDSIGNKSVVRVGDAQWMTAGRGIRHQENAPVGTIAHTLQLWINLPAAQKMTAPRVQNLIGDAVPVRRQAGVEIRVFSGQLGNAAAVTLNHVPVTMIEGRLEAGVCFTHNLRADENAFVVVLSGAIEIGPEDELVTAGELAWLTRAEAPTLSQVSVATTDSPARLLLFSASPLREPIAFGGPFVMNTEAEIRQAFADYRAGIF
ncbi:MAG: pirin [Rhodospirillales bacterium 20-58-10]|nr:MAG: pirin [Rhodospirillales bacterium 20-58-10]